MRTLIISTATPSTSAPAAITSPRCGWGRRTRSTRPGQSAGCSTLLASEAGIGGRLLARVVVEAGAGLAPVPARREHLAQRRRLGEAPLAEPVDQPVADRPQGVEPDEVGQRQRP